MSSPTKFYMMDFLREGIEEHASTILSIIGFILLIVGVLLLETFGSLLSAVNLFIGIVVLGLGMLMRLGLFYQFKIRSLDGLGSMLIIVGLICFALSLTALTFLSVKAIITFRIFVNHSWATDIINMFETMPITYRPYAWLSNDSFWGCIFTLVSGVAIKIYSSHH